MRILRVEQGNERPRYFVVNSDREMYDAALKILNEKRILMTEDNTPDAEREFVASICDEMDGDMALTYLTKRAGVELISPEVV